MSRYSERGKRAFYRLVKGKKITGGQNNLRATGEAVTGLTPNSKLSYEIAQIINSLQNISNGIGTASRLKVQNSYSNLTNLIFQIEEISKKLEYGSLDVGIDHFIGPLIFPAFDEVMLPRINRFGFWENQEARFIAKNIPMRGTFVNVGSNIGYHTIGTKKRRPDIQSIGLEPHPVLYLLSKVNAMVNDASVIHYEYAISKATEPQILYSSGYNVGDSRLFSFAESQKSIPIESITGLDFLHNLSGDIDFLLVDTQGTEFEVIDSFQFEEKKWPIIMFEMTPNWTLTLSQCLEKLAEYNKMGLELSWLVGGVEIGISIDEVERVFSSKDSPEYINLIIRSRKL